jgi:hypothetical protein
MKSIADTGVISKARREELDLAIVGEAIRILKNRHCFKMNAFRRYLRDLGLFVAVPDQVTPEWVHRIALSIAHGFVQSRAAEPKSNNATLNVN